MIIDCHSHCREENDPESTVWFPGEPPGPLPMKRFLAHLAGEELDHVLLSAHSRGMTTAGELLRRNDLVAEAAAAAPKLVSGLCQVNPHLPEASMQEIDRHVAKGSMVGLGEICGYLLDYENDDPRLFPFIERAAELDVPALVHCSREEHTAGLDRLAARVPNARLIMAHIGGMHNWPEGIRVARRHENLWADTSGYVMLSTGAMERALDELGASRLLFGVDFPAVRAAPLTAALDRLKLPSVDYERIAWRNTAELFKLDVGAITGS